MDVDGGEGRTKEEEEATDRKCDALSLCRAGVEEGGGNGPRVGWLVGWLAGWLVGGSGCVSQGCPSFSTLYDDCE